MLKKFFVLILVLLFINPCFAFKWEDRETGEKPYGVFINKTLIIDEKAKNLPIKDKKEYLKNLYDAKYVIYNKHNKIYSVIMENVNPDAPDVHFEYKFMYDENLNLILVNDYDKFNYIDINSNFYRYHIVVNGERNKLGLYDFKRKRFSGFKYDKIKETFSGAPVVVYDNKKQNVQPFKRIGNSVIRGVAYYPVMIGEKILAIFVMTIAGG